MKLGKKKIQELKENKFQFEELDNRYFTNSRDKIEVDNIRKLLNENICSFKELVDKFKSFEPYLYKVLNNEKLFEDLSKNNLLNKEDLRYSLNRIDNDFELNDLCRNTPLIKEILNEFALNKELIDRFNTIIEKAKYYKIHTIFDLIEYCNKNNEELLKLNELNRKFYQYGILNFDFSRDQKLELVELSQNNEIAQNRLNYIVENNLESNYDFDSLIIYLKKPEKKSLLNI